MAKEEAWLLKATGIVRRIDELGRVVIPKEIRRTLRIREGDPLEIFTDRDGEVILKKYSPIGELSGFAKEYTESLVHALGHTALICDKDQIVSAAGARARSCRTRTSAGTRGRAQGPPHRRRQRAGGRMIPILAEEGTPSPYAAQVITPILVEGEAVAW